VRLSGRRAALLAAVLILPLALAGCGRKGPLDPPPDSAVPTPAPAAAQSRYIDPTTPLGGPQQALPPQAAPPPPKKTFVLDSLLQ
jgi:predicted small lipoprotein YifL